MQYHAACKDILVRIDYWTMILDVMRICTYVGARMSGEAGQAKIKESRSRRLCKGDPQLGKMVGPI